MAKIILTSQFHVPGGKAYSSYADYMSRREALMEKEQDGSITDDEHQELLKVEYYISELGDTLGYSSLESVNAEDAKAKEAISILESGKIFKEGGDAYSRFVSYMSRRQALIKKSETSDLPLSEERELSLLDDKLTDYYKKYGGTDGPVIPGTFSKKHAQMTSHDELEVKDIMTSAQLGNSVLWTDVISFETDFLVEEKLLNPVTGELDMIRLQQASQKMMNVLMKEEKLDGFWYASVHTNKEHVHIHFSTVEMENSRPIVQFERNGVMCMEPKGKRKQKTLDDMRSAFANTLVDRSAELSRLSDLRNTLTAGVKETYKTDRPIQMLREVYNAVKAGGKYQYQKLDYSTKRKLDKLTDYLMKDNPDYASYVSAVKSESEFRDELYGEAKIYMRDSRGRVYKTVKNQDKDYAKNKLEDLRKRLGNALLKEMKKGLPVGSSVYEKKKVNSQSNFDRDAGNQKDNAGKTSADVKNSAGKTPQGSPPNVGRGAAPGSGYRPKPNVYSPQTKTPSGIGKMLSHLRVTAGNEYEMWLAEKAYEETERRVDLTQKTGGMTLG